MTSAMTNAAAVTLAVGSQASGLLRLSIRSGVGAPVGRGACAGSLNSCRHLLDVGPAPAIIRPMSSRACPG